MMVIRQVCDLAQRKRARLIGSHMHSRHDMALLQHAGKSDGHRQTGIRVSAYQDRE
jgi:hypothetical protein